MVLPEYCCRYWRSMRMRRILLPRDGGSRLLCMTQLFIFYVITSTRLVCIMKLDKGRGNGCDKNNT